MLKNRFLIFYTNTTISEISIGRNKALLASRMKLLTPTYVSIKIVGLGFNLNTESKRMFEKSK